MSHSKLQIGINPISWANDDLPALGGDTPLQTILREGKEIGFAGFELGGKFPKESKALGELLASHDLQLVSGRLMPTSFPGWQISHSVSGCGLPITTIWEPTSSLHRILSG
jgi:hypothetical protein